MENRKRRKVTATRPAVPVHIVEDHDQVLEPFHRAIGSKQLPFTGITVVGKHGRLPHAIFTQQPPFINTVQAHYRALQMRAYICCADDVLLEPL